MSSTTNTESDVVQLRRRLHKYPEPAWCEYYTTQLIVNELEKIGVDNLFLGEEIMDPNKRRNVPEKSELNRWEENAKDLGIEHDVLQRIKGGMTGVVGSVTQGEGPVVGIRVDIDGLRISEPNEQSHKPYAEGFGSNIENWMHACGHDANTAIGIKLLDTVTNKDFRGTLKVFFQPGSEVGGGAEPMAYGPQIDDIDYMINFKVGIGYPTGEIVAGIDKMFSYHQFEVDFTGEQAHYSVDPHEGASAVEAMSSSIRNLYSIHSHGEGQTRLNVAIVEGGSALAVLPEHASMKGEIRGETTKIKDYMEDQLVHRVTKTAELHNCKVEVKGINSGPSADSDEKIVGIIHEQSKHHPDVKSAIKRDLFNSADDGSHFLEVVKSNGGYGAFTAIGADLPSGHHTRTFDIDERCLQIGTKVLTNTISQLK